MAGKQRSFGQFDTGGAVVRQKKSDEGRKAAEQRNVVNDAGRAAQRKSSKGQTINSAERRAITRMRDAQTTDSNN